MTILAAACVMAFHTPGLLAQRGSGGYKLGLYQDHFSLVNHAGQVLERYSLADPWSKRPTSLLFAKGNVEISWTADGLRVRHGRQQFTTQFAGYPVSPRLRKQEDIVLALNEHWDLKAFGISGAVRIGDAVYLVPRWQRGGQIWLEVLVKIPLTGRDPRPEALAVVTGQSLSAAKVEDNLFASGLRLAMPVRDGLAWGIWSYDMATGFGQYNQKGIGIKFAKGLSDGSVGFVEKRGQDHFEAGIIAADLTSREAEWESDSPIRFVDAMTPAAVTSEEDGETYVHVLETGRRIAFEPTGHVRRGELGLLIWEGDTAPIRATVTSLRTGAVLATWKRDAKKGAVRAPRG